MNLTNIAHRNLTLAEIDFVNKHEFTHFFFNLDTDLFSFAKKAEHGTYVVYNYYEKSNHPAEQTPYLRHVKIGDHIKRLDTIMFSSIMSPSTLREDTMYPNINKMVKSVQSKGSVRVEIDGNKEFVFVEYRARYGTDIQLKTSDGRTITIKPEHDYRIKVVD